MDLTFILVTLILIIFLFISYLLRVIKSSTPLLLIYLIFCFTYIIDNETSKDDIIINDDIKDIQNIKGNSKIIDNRFLRNKNIDNLNEEKSEISKPVVSFNPKPIFIDTNIINQKEKERDTFNGNEIKEKIPLIIKKDEDNMSNQLKLNEVMICRGVYKRNPIKPGFTFSNNVDSIFCYTKISNTGPKHEIKHLWYYENKLITAVTYNIKTSYNYRSWSKKTILPSQIGEWRVDIIDDKENVLGSRKFQISSLNNVF
tara:strand:- start:160 stop:930 length:771 start_codon:yes stop_codon:yes gene_type:complete